MGGMGSQSPGLAFRYPPRPPPPVPELVHDVLNAACVLLIEGRGGW
jgi:hypothetical protein